MTRGGVGDVYRDPISLAVCLVERIVYPSLFTAIMVISLELHHLFYHEADSAM